MEVKVFSGGRRPSQEIKVTSSARPASEGFQISTGARPSSDGIQVSAGARPTGGDVTHGHGGVQVSSAARPVSEIKVASSTRPLQIHQRSVESPTPNDHHKTMTSSVPAYHTKTEYFNEETHSRTNVSIHRPLTPGDLINSTNVFNVFYFALLVLASTFLCIVTEGEISLVYLLPLVAIAALVSFHYLKL